MNKLKVVSWNMDFWKSKHKDKGWEFINSQDPDVSLLSECIDHPSQNFSIHHISKNKWGTGVFSKHKIVEHELELKIGETGLAFYQAYNPTSKPVAGTASFNVFPYSAGGYFTKIACFCFEEQVLQPGEKIDMPVSFYIDPDIVKDKEAKFAKSITLSYTFHRTELPQDQASLFQSSDK